MAMYVGLTDNPEQRSQQHGSPSDWRLYSPFLNEDQARGWEKEAIERGFKGGPGGAGWKYGYTHTITSETREE